MASKLFIFLLLQRLHDLNLNHIESQDMEKCNETCTFICYKRMKKSAGINNDAQSIFTDSTRRFKYALLYIDDNLLWNWVILFRKCCVSSSCKGKVNMHVVSMYICTNEWTYNRVNARKHFVCTRVFFMLCLREWESKYGL